MAINTVREELLRQLTKAAKMEEPVTVEEVKDTGPDPRESDPMMKEYAQIIGTPHPSGRKYFFTRGKTWFEKSDWTADHAQDIPEVKEEHVFDHRYALSILLGMELDQPLMAYGPPGCGKSVTPEQVCARVNRPFLFISGMGGAEPADYIGSPWVEDGNMKWKDGKASYAVRNGYFMLYDEPFKVAAQNNMWCQSLLDARRVLQLQGHPDPVHGTLRANPRFRVMLADNTQGLGDGMDRYAADMQDQSLLSRCTLNVQVDYMTVAQEATLLARLYPTMDGGLVDKIASLASLIRAGWKKGTIRKPYSVRDTQTLCMAVMACGSVAMAFDYTYFQAIADDKERAAIKELFNNTVKFGPKEMLV